MTGINDDTGQHGDTGLRGVEAIVAGGGIGGLTAAAALAAAGLDVTVHERRPDLTEA